MKRGILIITVATLLTALIVGYGVYEWNRPTKETPKAPIHVFGANVITDGE